MDSVEDQKYTVDVTTLGPIIIFVVNVICSREIVATSQYKLL